MCPLPGSRLAKTYDVLGNLTGVVQNGSRNRAFNYNSLSQLTSATNPESGTTCYDTLLAGVCQPDGYDANGNLITKTDARSTRTNFAYDALNRLTQKSYSDTTPTVKYGYDAVTPPSCTLPALTISNGIGKRTGMCGAAGAEAWSYDLVANVGWKTTDVRTTNGVTKTSVYQNNLGGLLASVPYPSGRTITYTPSVAGRTVSAVDTASAINYATGALYSPAGALTSLSNGANLVSTLYYNNRSQPCRISVKSSGMSPTSCTDSINFGNVLDFSYNFKNSCSISITSPRPLPALLM
ncbi:MAG TPA: hypothetical protein VOA41_20885 [Candidatus Dormibacteraeota bacterium]|nr:hypothetical protein [Candidatus Dormibacteraeota bacterium]